MAKITHAKITQEGVLKLARISNISIDATEVERLAQELDEILNYASFLKDIAPQGAQYTLPQNTNVTREDVSRACNPEKVLALAPERQEDYFVVPVIISNK